MNIYTARNSEYKALIIANNKTEALEVYNKDVADDQPSFEEVDGDHLIQKMYKSPLVGIEDIYSIEIDISTAKEAGRSSLLLVDSHLI